MLDCDHLDPAVAQKRQEEAAYLSEYSALLKTALASRPEARRIVRTDVPSAEAAAPGRTVVSVCVCTTSRHTQAAALTDLALFSIMLPSLRDSLKPAQSAAEGLHAWLSSAAASAASAATSIAGGDDAGAAGGEGGGEGGEGGGAGGGADGGMDDDEESGAGAEAFEYWLYILYDVGDAFYDSAAKVVAPPMAL